MINEKLYKRLLDLFGEGGVQILHEDVSMSCEYLRNSMGGSGRSKRLNPIMSGEEYLVRCPFCHDHKTRLTINHRYGVWDDETQTRNTWLAQCYNDQCLTDYENRQKLRDLLFDADSVLPRPFLTNGPIEREVKSFELPLGSEPLTQIVKKTPSHHAIEYLESRLFPVATIAKTFSLYYCGNCDNPNVCDRIIAPAYRDKKLAGWQARYIGKPPTRQIPKWYTCPSMKTSLTGYNYDNAIKHFSFVIVEGPADVWGIGSAGLGLFGKVISNSMRSSLEEVLKQRDGSIILMLDPKQSDVDARAKSKHHLEKAYDQLVTSSILKDRVLPVFLPEHLDPGSADRAFMIDLIKREASRKKIKFSLERI